MSIYVVDANGNEIKVAGGSSAVSGVTSFNGRDGAVTPQAGDYTAEMVGARADTWLPTAAEVGAATPADVATKQNKLVGTQGQIVGFNAAGDAVAQDAPESDVSSFNGRTGAITPESGDYTAGMVGALPITGGTLTGNVLINTAESTSPQGIAIIAKLPMVQFGESGDIVLKKPLDSDMLTVMAPDVQFQVDGDTFSIKNLKTSVSEGKAAIASAITDKGVSTSPTDAFSTMAQNILEIDTAKPLSILSFRSVSVTSISPTTIKCNLGSWNSNKVIYAVTGFCGTGNFSVTNADTSAFPTTYRSNKNFSIGFTSLYYNSGDAVNYKRTLQYLVSFLSSNTANVSNVLVSGPDFNFYVSGSTLTITQKDTNYIFAYPNTSSKWICSVLYLES